MGRVIKKEAPLDARPLISVRKTKQAVAEYRLKNLPPGKNLEQCLQEMEGRWHKVISPKEKEQLIRDVRRQIKFKLEPVLEARKNIPVTFDSIDEMADGIIMGSPFLAEMDSDEKIHQYVALYITKLLMHQMSSAGWERASSTSNFS
jgi:hypothetical protein